MLLRVLVLVVLSVTCAVILRLWVVAALAVALLLLLLPTPLATVVTCACTITAGAGGVLRGTISCILWGRDIGLPYLGSTPGRDIGATCCNVMTGRARPGFSSISAWTFSTLSELCHEVCVFRVEATTFG